MGYSQYIKGPEYGEGSRPSRMAVTSLLVEAGGWQRSYREEEERIKAEAREDLVTESRDEISLLCPLACS